MKACRIYALQAEISTSGNRKNIGDEIQVNRPTDCRVFSTFVLENNLEFDSFITVVSTAASLVVPADAGLLCHIIGYNLFAE